MLCNRDPDPDREEKGERDLARGDAGASCLVAGKAGVEAACGASDGGPAFGEGLTALRGVESVKWDWG